MVFLLLLLIVSGCATKKQSDEDVGKMVTMAKDLSKSAYLSSSRSQLDADFTKYRKQINDDVYRKYFDVKNNDVYNQFYAYSDIMHVEYTPEDTIVVTEENDVTTVYTVSFVSEYVNKEVEEASHQIRAVLKYTFNREGKLIAFKRYA